MAMFHTAPHLYLSSGVSVSRLSFPATQASLCLTSFFSILSFLSAATIDALSLTLWKRPSPFHCIDWKRHQHCSCHLNSPHLFLFLWGALRSSPHKFPQKKSPISSQTDSVLFTATKALPPPTWMRSASQDLFRCLGLAFKTQLGPRLWSSTSKNSRRLLTQEAAVVEKC